MLDLDKVAVVLAFDKNLLEVFDRIIESVGEGTDIDRAAFELTVDNKVSDKDLLFFILGLITVREVIDKVT